MFSTRQSALQVANSSRVARSNGRQAVRLESAPGNCATVEQASAAGIPAGAQDRAVQPVCEACGSSKFSVTASHNRVSRYCVACGCVA